MKTTTTAKGKYGCFTERCNCKSDFQDEKYGLGMRIFNKGGNDKKRGTCTVCGRTV